MDDDGQDLGKMSGPSGVVVTGAGGYIGGAIVSYLLQHTSVPRVHATVRGDVDSPRYEALRALDTLDATTQNKNHDENGQRRLYLFSADLNEPDAFDEPCRGCSSIIHVAAPTTMQCRGVKEAYERIVDPGIRGVEHVVRSAEKMKLKTVVFTSSMAAVQGDGWERGQAYVYSERDWNQLDSTPKENPYACMKVMAERRLWELYNTRAPGSSWERLVVLCPGFVLGAPSTDVCSELVDFMILLMKGKLWPIVPNYFFSMVHLEDVARAHVLAAVGGIAGSETGALGSDEACAKRYILAAGDRTLGLKDVVCGPVKEGIVARLETTLGKRDGGRGGGKGGTSYSSYVSYLRWPQFQAPKWLLRVLSMVLPSVHWPLVRAYLNKPSRYDGTKVERELPGFGAYLDPIDGFLDLLVWVVERGLA